MTEEPKNYAKVDLKKSSSSGKEGYDIQIQASEGITQEHMDKIADIAVKTALKTRKFIGGD